MSRSVTSISGPVPAWTAPRFPCWNGTKKWKKWGLAEDWFQIRVKRDGRLGWVDSRYLSPTPVAAPEAAPPSPPVEARRRRRREVPPPPLPERIQPPPLERPAPPRWKSSNPLNRKKRSRRPGRNRRRPNRRNRPRRSPKKPGRGSQRGKTAPEGPLPRRGKNLRPRGRETGPQGRKTGPTTGGNPGARPEYQDYVIAVSFQLSAISYQLSAKNLIQKIAGWFFEPPRLIF